MTTRTGLAFAMLFLLVNAACSSRGSRHSHSYASPSYASPSYSTPSYSTPAVTANVPSATPADVLSSGKLFASPQAAMAAVAEVCGTHDKVKIEEIFGPGATEVLWSGDDVSDREAGLRVKAMIESGVTFEERSPDETVAAVGKDKWPFPIPLMKTAEGWRFDLEAGKDEMLSRRIGRNELETISTMYEYVEAQKEYRGAGRDGNPPAYAQRVRSGAGKHDGLYWASAEGEAESPFGEFIAEARKEGYAESEAPQAFHGYFYKILTGQGPHAAGGNKSYLDAKGLMTGGFAAVAWPATYGNSGVMTFIVGPAGIVFEKDHGERTESMASAIAAYDPDKSWHPTARKPATDDE